MALKFDRADRNYMRAFAFGIGALALITLVDIGIATWVWASQQKPDPKLDVAFAASTPTLLGTSQVTNRAAAVQTAQAAPTPPAQAAPATASSSPSSATAPQPAAPATTTVAYQYDGAQGKNLFDGTCAACHQATGDGIAGVFPPLHGNAAVDNADPTTQIVTILKGRHGDKIDGKAYSGAMPPFAGQFSDAQIADIANYERSSWGNQAKHVTPDAVAALRAK